jgi:CHAT domain-containing protein
MYPDCLWKKIWMFSLPVLVIALNSCAYNIAHEKDKLIATAQYDKLEKYTEGEVSKSVIVKTKELFPLCIAYSKLKKYNKLFPCLDQLENNIRKGDKYDHFQLMGDYDISPVLPVIRANAYLELGAYDRAVEESKKVDRPIPEASTWSHYSETSIHLQAWSIISIAHTLKGERDKSKIYLDRLKEKNIEFVGGAFKKPEKRNSIAKALMALGEYKEALEYLDDSDSGFRNLADGLLGFSAAKQSVYSYVELPKLFMHNKCLFETGLISEAKDGYTRLLNIPQTRDNGEIYWLILQDLGRIAEIGQNIKDAAQHYRQAVKVIERQRSTIHTEVSKIGFVGDKQAVYNNLVRVLYQDKHYEEAFEYVERAKARALVDLLATKKDFAVKGGNEQEIKTVLAMYDSAEAEAIIQDASAIDRNKTRSIQIKTREDLRAKAPELASLVTVTSPTLSDIQSTIPKEEVLIEYYYRDKDMYAFILSDGRLQTVKLDSDGLVEDVQTFRKLIETPSSSRFMDMSGKLYRRLFEPLQSGLNKKSLIIVSHGALHYLPMNALHDGKGYLIDRYSIRMMPSASAMKYLGEKKTSKTGGILSFGNPDLGNPKFDLEHAQTEAAEVAKIFPRSKVFARKEATEEALRNNCADYRYFHFATHGQFNPDAPLKSALLLAPDAKHNGMLTADKLYSMNLDADLVTLSACETGLSKIANGDDLVGLTRGFLYAGSSSIVASLWKVDDLATSQLMTRFYSEMSKTNKREALRDAQLETKKKYPHPYYWAAFQLTGSAN